MERIVSPMLSMFRSFRSYSNSDWKSFRERTFGSNRRQREDVAKRCCCHLLFPQGQKQNDHVLQKFSIGEVRRLLGSYTAIRTEKLDFGQLYGVEAVLT